MKDIFSGSKGYYGYFNPNSEDGVSVYFQRASGGSDQIGEGGEGFLAESYRISWQRALSKKRVFNSGKPLVIVGFGNGTVTFSGMVGTKEGFEKLVGNNSDGSNEDICNPLTITIKSTQGFQKCTDNGTGDKTDVGIELKLDHCILQGIGVTGQYQENGAIFQQADITFEIGSLSY